LLRNEYLFVGSSIVAAAVFGVLVHRFFEAPVDRYLSGRSARATVPGASKASGGPVVASRPAVTTLPGE
jgi:hypothetical protein